MLSQEILNEFLNVFERFWIIAAIFSKTRIIQIENLFFCVFLSFYTLMLIGIIFGWTINMNISTNIWEERKWVGITWTWVNGRDLNFFEVFVPNTIYFRRLLTTFFPLQRPKLFDYRKLIKIIYLSHYMSRW